MTQKGLETRSKNARKRHENLKAKVNELYSQTIDGLRLDIDGIIEKVAKDNGYSPRRVKEILKS